MNESTKSRGSVGWSVGQVPWVKFRGSNSVGALKIRGSNPICSPFENIPNDIHIHAHHECASKYHLEIERFYRNRSVTENRENVVILS